MNYFLTILIFPVIFLSSSTLFTHDDDQRGIKEAILTLENLAAPYDPDHELSAELSQICLATVSRIVQIMEPLLKNMEPLTPKFYEFSTSAKDADAVKSFSTFAKDETGLTMTELFVMVEETRRRVEDIFDDGGGEIKNFVAGLALSSGTTQVFEAGLFILTKMAEKSRDQLELFATYLRHIDPSVVEASQKPISSVSVIDVHGVAGEIRRVYQYQTNLEDEELTYQIRNILDRASLGVTLILNGVNKILKPLPPFMLDKWQSVKKESKTFNLTNIVEQLQEYRQKIDQLVSSTINAIETLNQSEETELVSTVFFSVVQQNVDKILKLEHQLQEENGLAGEAVDKFFERLDKIVASNGAALNKMKERMDHFYDGTVAGPSIKILFEKTEMEAVKISEIFLKKLPPPERHLLTIVQFSEEYESRWTRLVELTLDSMDEILADEIDLILAQVEKVVTEFEEEVQSGLEELKMLTRQIQNLRTTTSMTCDDEGSCGLDI